MIELLTVIAVVGALLPVAGRLFSDGWRVLHRARNQAEDHQLVAVVMKRWCKELGQTSPDEWELRNGGFRAGRLNIRVEDNRLVFDNGAAGAGIRLPRGIGCSFSIDRHENSADCAVLTLAMRSAYYRRVTTNNVRIVACGRRTRM